MVNGNYRHFVKSIHFLIVQRHKQGWIQKELTSLPHPIDKFIGVNIIVKIIVAVQVKFNCHLQQAS